MERTHVIRPTYMVDHRERLHWVYVKIRWDGTRLSITGVEGPIKSGNCHGGCGQIRLDPNMASTDPGWTPAKVARLNEIWDRWHLNDMRAGTPRQQAWLREHGNEYPGYPTSHFVWACERLAEVGLQPDGDYRYGSKWLSEDVPAEIIDELFAYPASPSTPAWV